MAIDRKALKRSTLTIAQKAVVTKAWTAGGELGVALDNGQCAYLVARIVKDLELDERFPEMPNDLQPFFETTDLESLRLDDLDFLGLFEKLVGMVLDADTYFDCLATLHKRRLKYEKILEAQPIPTLNQVGPRSLLQYGTLSSKALAGLLFWRKWLFDIDNRAGQETGYIFEPIVARCTGGQSYSAKKSPVRRRNEKNKGRQVDCIFENKAYEIKLRVTIAASGQGRWGEEKDFPADCQASGYIPILLVFDDTQADKLDELSQVFREAGGDVKIGEEAWQHLEDLAGQTMSTFLEKYVRAPLKDLLDNAPDRDSLPELCIRLNEGKLIISIAGETLSIERSPIEELATEADSTTNEANDQSPET